jgi:Helix-turn-helix.
MQNGERLAAVRKENKHTQKETADLIGSTARNVRRWEKNETEIGAEKLKVFCEYYNVSSDYILDLSDQKTTSK